MFSYFWHRMGREENISADHFSRKIKWIIVDVLPLFDVCLLHQIFFLCHGLVQVYQSDIEVSLSGSTAGTQKETA